MKKPIALTLFILVTLSFSQGAYAKATKGEANLVNFESGTLVVHDNSDDPNHTFIVDKKNRLKNIKVGDKITVQSPLNDPTTARKITKDPK